MASVGAVSTMMPCAPSRMGDSVATIMTSFDTTFGPDRMRSIHACVVGLHKELGKLDGWNGQGSVGVVAQVMSDLRMAGCWANDMRLRWRSSELRWRAETRREPHERVDAPEAVEAVSDVSLSSAHCGSTYEVPAGRAGVDHLGGG